MGTIELRADELVAHSYRDTKSVQPESVADLVPYFFHSIALNPAYRFGDLIRLVDRPDADFLGSILGERILPVLQEARGGAEPEEDRSIEYLRVYNTHEGDRLLREFDGWGRWPEPSWRKQPETPREGAIAVELTPVPRLLDLPLRYEPALVLLNEKGQEAYRTEIDITLIEFLKAIFYELTFFGTPEERDGTREDLEERVRRINAGEEELIPAGRVFREVGERPDQLRGEKERRGIRRRPTPRG